MKQVYLLDSFQDIEKAFSSDRQAGDATPAIEERARLHISKKSLTLTGTAKFVLSEDLKTKGEGFVKHCIIKCIGNKYELNQASFSSFTTKEADDY